MAKYIHKQAAIHALVNEANIHNNPIKRAYTRAVVIIEQITAADVQPVKRGFWRKTNDIFFKYCSVCGTKTDIAYSNAAKFCPECGAKMDAEPDEPWQSEWMKRVFQPVPEEQDKIIEIIHEKA